MVRAGNVLQVGDSIDDALAAFKPDRNGYKVAEMPPGWKDDRFKCDGWETGTTGFGAITYEDRVVVAVYHEDRVSEDRLREIMESYEQVIPGAATQLTGSRVRYWFWEDGTQRLMICAVQPPNEGLSLTIALGESSTMNYLGMNPSIAEKDRVLAENFFQKGLERKQSSKD